MSNPKIASSSEIALRSAFNKKYMGYRHQTQTFASCFPPPAASPLLKNMGKVDRVLKFQIIAQTGENGGWITQGSRVYLVHRPSSEEEEQPQKNAELYLTCTARNEVKFDKKTSNEESNRMLLKSALWTIAYASMQKQLLPPSRSDLTLHDAVVLKSVYGSYLTVQPATQACTTLPEMDQQRSVWNLHPAASLPAPAWLFTKPSFAKFIVPSVGELVPARRTLRACAPQVQEMLLVEDLLDVMLGFEGTYIRRRAGTALFVIEPHLESPSCSTALAQLTYRILQLPSHYERLMRFMREQEYRDSLLSQALCDGLKEMVYQYYQQVIQLDERHGQGGLTLQALWVQVQDALKVLRALGQLVEAANGKRGGQLLTCLQALLTQTTDRHVLFIYKHLYGRLTKLYLKMLAGWIYEGRLEDRHGEFMVRREESGGQWNYWEERFVLREEMVPSVLERDSRTILVTGKFINILRACNRDAVCPFAGELVGEQGTRVGFTEPIQKAYQWANTQLKQLIFTECKLQEVLTSLKGYFFLNYGDLFLHFLDAAEDDLALPKKLKTDTRKQFSLQKLQNLFELNVRTSSAANDPYKEDITLKLENSTVFQQIYRIKTIQSQLFGFNFSQKPFLKKDARYVDFVTLDFRCSFPLSLILNKRAIAKYQCLFRHLFWFKFLQRQLNLCWVKLQNTSQSNVQCFRGAYITNNRIMHFIKSFIYYLSEEVIEMNWIRLTQELAKANNLEEIISYHERFLNACLKESLLTNQSLLQILASDIGNTAQNYFRIKEYLAQIEVELDAVKEARPIALQERREYLRNVRQQVAELVEEKQFVEFITESSNAFNELIGKFVQDVSQSTAKEENHLLRLSQMLNEENHTRDPRRYQ